MRTGAEEAMDMNDLLQTVVTQLPNLGVAVWMLWQQQGTIKSLLDNQQKLIDRLLTYVDGDKDRAARIMEPRSQ